jgi:ubiquinone/menaquinone biosynthesis C-methylase UbiE
MESIYDHWAEYYDVAEGDRNLFLKFYVPMIGPAIRSVLELGCGTGVITTALAKRMAVIHRGNAEIRVTGLDESAEMLRVARTRDNQIEWVLGDFRNPPLQGEYDLIICPFNALQFMLNEQDLQNSLRAARRHLKPDGRFAFDIYQPNLAYLATPQADRLVRSVRGSHGEALELRDAFVYDATSRVMTLEWRLIDPRRPILPLAKIVYHLRQYFAPEIESALKSTGLCISERYGDFDRSTFTAASKRQVLVCRRAL